MKCEDCQSNPAVVTIAETYNGKHTQLHLCEECAAQRGYINFGSGMAWSKLLGSFFVSSPVQVGQVGLTNNKTCPNCGIGLNAISHSGKLGCSECYETFREQLEPTLRRIHSNTGHTGKIPKRGASKIIVKRKIEALKTKLQAAVAEEQYEQAAELRDEIKNLEMN
ncbi:MAG: hypothetical protein GXY50_08985 [Syntrophomonadaceae bacterium]|nr:hypothetical protein [Syntrophomonadaceae bacterium]